MGLRVHPSVPWERGPHRGLGSPLAHPARASSTQPACTGPPAIGTGRDLMGSQCLECLQGRVLITFQGFLSPDNSAHSSAVLSVLPLLGPQTRPQPQRQLPPCPHPSFRSSPPTSQGCRLPQIHLADSWPTQRCPVASETISRISQLSAKFAFGKSSGPGVR